MSNGLDRTVEVSEGPEHGYFEVHVRCGKLQSVVESIIIAIERMSARLHSVNLVMEPSISVDVVAEQADGRTSEDLAILRDMLLTLTEPR